MPTTEEYISRRKSSNSSKERKRERERKKAVRENERDRGDEQLWGERLAWRLGCQLGHSLPCTSMPTTLMGDCTKFQDLVWPTAHGKDPH